MVAKKWGADYVIDLDEVPDPDQRVQHKVERVVAKDIIHDAVKNALLKDGWTITADPHIITYGDDKLYVDLAGERPIAAERNNRKIAVEVKSFVGRSPLHDFEIALGQYMHYLGLLELTEPERKLYLAVNHIVYRTLFQQKTF